MRTLLILRFRDFGHDTIAQHQEILRDRQAVWWGWWKKSSETIPESLSDLDLSSTRVGLYDSGADRYYQASVDAVQMFDGDAGPTPDQRSTPAYYNDERLPAWFRFTSVRELGEHEFEAAFPGFVPSASTLALFEGIGQDSGAGHVETSLGVDHSEDSGIVSAPGEAILHLSDLHFGKDHGFLFQPDAVSGLTLVDALLHGVESAGGSVGVVVVSGDLTTGGEGFTEAGEFLRELAVGLSLRHEHFIIVPGNHDIELAAAKPTNYDHEQPYLNFCRSFYLEDIDRPQSFRSFSTPSGCRYHVAGLNSVRLRDQEHKEYGFVGQDRYRPMFERLASAPSAPNGRLTLRAAVLHHHVLPVGNRVAPIAGRPSSMTLDAGGLIADAQLFGVHLLLHGHQHLPFIGQTSRVQPLTAGSGGAHDRRVLVVGNGSTGVEVARIDSELPYNSFGLYTPNDHHLSLRMFRFNTATAPSPHLEIDWPIDP